MKCKVMKTWMESRKVEIVGLGSSKAWVNMCALRQVTAALHMPLQPLVVDENSGVYCEQFMHVCIITNIEHGGQFSFQTEPESIPKQLCTSHRITLYALTNVQP